MKTYCLIDFHNKNNLRSLTELHTSMQKQSVEKFDDIALIITCLHYNVLMFTPKIKCLKLFYCDDKIIHPNTVQKGKVRSDRK